MAHIALESGDSSKALELWTEALKLAMDTGNAEGIYHVAGTLGRTMAAENQNDPATQLLELALNAARSAGFPGSEELETLLAQTKAST